MSRKAGKRQGEGAMPEKSEEEVKRRVQKELKLGGDAPDSFKITKVEKVRR